MRKIGAGNMGENDLGDEEQESDGVKERRGGSSTKGKKGGRGKEQEE